MKGEGVDVGSMKEDIVEIGPPVSRGREVKELVKEDWSNIDEIYIEEGDNDNDDDVGSMKEDDVEIDSVSRGREVKELVKEDWSNIDEIYIEEGDNDNDDDVGSMKEDDVEIDSVSRGREVKELVKENWDNIDGTYIEGDNDNDDGASDEDNDVWEVLLLTAEVCADTSDAKLSELMVEGDWGSDKRDDNDVVDRGDGKEGFVFTEQDAKGFRFITLQLDAFVSLISSLLLILTGVLDVCEFVELKHKFRSICSGDTSLVKVRDAFSIVAGQSLQVLIQ